MTRTFFAEIPQFPIAPAIKKSEYRSRLKKLWQRMADNSICVLLSNSEQTRSNDTHFPFRQSSDIVYLNAFPEPNSALVLTKFAGKQQLIMLVQNKDKEREVWDGFRHGVDGAKDKFLADHAYPVSEFTNVIGKLLDKAETVYYRFGQNQNFDEEFRKLWEPQQKQLLNPQQILNEMRLYKSEAELQLLRYAGEVSAEAHKQAMQLCKPGIGEHQLQAVLEYVFKTAGALAPAYGTIVAAGNNACTLHYVKNDATIENGDLVLIDAGAEFGAQGGGYASDITRTFPANGKFSEAQRQLYQLVLDSQLAAIKASKPGVKLMHVQQTAERVLRHGLIKLGIIPASSSAHAARSKSRQKENSAPTLRDFLPHGCSHWMGIDVHDVGDYHDWLNKSRSKKQRILEAGMVFTIEPGLYIDKNDERVPAKYRGIGIRIEDDIVITADGNEVLTAGVPKSVEEIEALMAQRR